METKEIGNYLIEIDYDNDPINPRKEWDNVGKMVCFHKRYDLGDKHDYKSDNYSSWEELKDAIMENENVHTILPLYLYDHSGITISNTSFSCQWDSGQVGFIYATKEAVQKYEVKDELVSKLLESETLDYDTYLRGEVYYWKTYKKEVCDKGHEHLELLDSCHGYFDRDSAEADAEASIPK